MRCIILLSFFLALGSSLEAVIYVRPPDVADSLLQLWPWSEAEIGLDATVDNEPDFDEIRVLPGIYWEQVDITALTSLRTTNQLITGWIPGALPDSGHVASGEESSSIMIKSAIRATPLEDVGINLFQFTWEGNDTLGFVRVYSDTTAWKQRQVSDPAQDKSYYLLTGNRSIVLNFDPVTTDQSTIAVLSSNMPSDYHYALLVDVDSTTQDLTIANLTLQHGKYGAASLHTSDLRQDTFDNVTFMDSYLSEFRFNQSQVDSLTFQNCHFIKHAIPDMRTTGKHIIFDGTGNQDHYDFHHVLFDHCHFRAESTLPPVDLTAFSKGRSSTRMVDLDGLTFQDCTFTGPYTSAINIQQDWQMDDPSCQLRNRNITIAGCDFSGCQSAIDLYPPIRQVQIVGNNQFTDCLNGIDIHFAPTSSEADSISATHSCFSDSIRIEDNHFTRIGHWDAQVFANTMRDLAYERLYGATISPGLVGWVKSQVDSLIGTQGIGIRIAGHMRDLKVSDNQFDMLGTRAISIQNVNAMEITCNIVSEPIWV